MTVVVAAVAGFLAARLAWLGLRPVFAQPLFARENYRGRTVPTGAGLVVVVAFVVVEAGRAVAGAAGVGDPPGVTGERALVLLAATGFALVGLFDDLGGSVHARGFRGHLSALGRGELTTGGLKLLAGGLLALVVVAPAAGESLPRLAADAALVALAANLGNLFDRAPGRAVKVGALAFVVVAVATAGAAVLAPVAVVVGAALALLPDDLGERLMLGDAGANALGAVVGLGVVLACSPLTRTVVLVAVAVLNLASEAVSFSRVIDAVPPLRALDRLGRRA